MVVFEHLQVGDKYRLGGREYVLLEKIVDDKGRVVGVVNRLVQGLEQDSVTLGLQSESHR